MIDTLLVYKGAAADQVSSYKPTCPEEVDKHIKEAVAWITIDNTNIDYPIMQGETNSEYLNKNPQGEFELSGSIFLDYRNASDFSDQYSLTYGHHMQNDNMYGGLDHFLEDGYIDSHRTGTLITKKKTYRITIFAASKVDASAEAVFQPTETTGVLDYIRANASIFEEPKNDHIIALSTCTNANTTSRTVVFGYLEEQ